MTADALPAAEAAMTRPDPIRVASFPAEHPYVDAVRPDVVHSVAPTGPSDTSPWAPHRWWQPAELAGQAGCIDLLHVHFGFDHLSTEEMSDWTAELGRLGLPLVVTVHDLRNPHHPTADLHEAHLSALLAAAAEVITLTPGAAEQIRRRWGRQAWVLDHPTLVRPPPRPSRVPGRLVAGLHLKSLRRNLLEPDRVVAAAAQGAQAAGGSLVVDVHPDVVDRAELTGVRVLSAAGRLRLRVHDRFTDEELVGYLQELDVSVLPHRFGTHSGWLEACRDLGTRVVAPDCGYYTEQWPDVHSYRNNEADGLDPVSLSAAVAAALAAAPLSPADPLIRAAERTAVRRGHFDVYRRAMAVGARR